MNHYVLVSVDLPKPDVRLSENLWAVARERLRKIEMPNEGSKRLSENVWLLERDSAVLALAQIVVVAYELKLGYEVRYLSFD